MTGYQTPFIFLAEDDLDDQELLIEAFTRHSRSLTIETATNGKKAVVFLEALPDSFLPCLIVLDFNLPEIDGAQILKLLSENNRFIRYPRLFGARLLRRCIRNYVWNWERMLIM